PSFFIWSRLALIVLSDGAGGGVGGELGAVAGVGVVDGLEIDPPLALPASPAVGLDNGAVGVGVGVGLGVGCVMPRSWSTRSLSALASSGAAATNDSRNALSCDRLSAT